MHARRTNLRLAIGCGAGLAGSYWLLMLATVAGVDAMFPLVLLMGVGSVLRSLVGTPVLVFLGRSSTPDGS